jgi:hypothetical protein
MTVLNFGIRAYLLFLLFCIALTACSGTVANNSNTSGTVANNSNTNSDGRGAKNEYPPEVVDAFLKSCEGAGSRRELCSCILDKIQRKYTFEEFSVLETKMRAGRTPDDFLEFSGKARADCAK